MKALSKKQTLAQGTPRLSVKGQLKYFARSSSSLSRLCVRRHALPPRQKLENESERSSRDSSTKHEKNNTFPFSFLSDSFSVEKALKGTVATTLALTQVLGNAVAVHNQDLALDATHNTQQQSIETKQSQPQSPSRSPKSAVLATASVAQLQLQGAPPVKVEIAAPTEEVDLYRDTLLRYAGYANEVGESFKNLISRSSYKMSYAIAICYVLADATDKGLKAENTVATAIAAEVQTKDSPSAQANDKIGKNPQIEVAKAAMDTLIWQGLASVIIPGFTINRIVWAANKMVESDSIPKLPPSAKKWAPTIIGLSFIPFIVHPIDEGVTKLLDLTIRQFY